MKKSDNLRGGIFLIALCGYYSALLPVVYLCCSISCVSSVKNMWMVSAGCFEICYSKCSTAVSIT